MLSSSCAGKLEFSWSGNSQSEKKKHSWQTRTLPFVTVCNGKTAPSFRVYVFVCNSEPCSLWHCGALARRTTRFADSVNCEERKAKKNKNDPRTERQMAFC